MIYLLPPSQYCSLSIEPSPLFPSESRCLSLSGTPSLLSSPFPSLSVTLSILCTPIFFFPYDRCSLSPHNISCCFSLEFFNFISTLASLPFIPCFLPLSFSLTCVIKYISPLLFDSYSRPTLTPFATLPPPFTISCPHPLISVFLPNLFHPPLPHDPLPQKMSLSISLPLQSLLLLPTSLSSYSTLAINIFSLDFSQPLQIYFVLCIDLSIFLLTLPSFFLLHLYSLPRSFPSSQTPPQYSICARVCLHLFPPTSIFLTPHTISLKLSFHSILSDPLLSCTLYRLYLLSPSPLLSFS